MTRYVFVFAVLTIAQPVFSQSIDNSASREHFFPLIADGGGFRSHLFLSNASGAVNQCTMELIGDGLDMARFERRVEVAGNGAFATIDLSRPDAAVTVSSLGEGAYTSGYAKFDCSEPAVARLLLISEVGGVPVSMAVVESAELGTSFQFPVLPRLGSLGLVIASDGNAATSCAVAVTDFSGNEVGEGSHSVPAQSMSIGFLDNIVALPSGFEGGAATVSCDREIFALGQPSNGSLFTALPVVRLPEDDKARTSHVLPLVADGEGFRSELLITNLTAGANQCSLELHGLDLQMNRFFSSTRVSASDATATLELNGSGDLLSIQGKNLSDLAFGYATLECGEAVVARNLLTAEAQENVAGMAVIPSSQQSGGFTIPVEPGLGQLAIIMNNDSAVDASCGIELNAGDGTSLGQRTAHVPSKSTAVRFVHDLYQIPRDYDGGNLTVGCDGPVSAVSLPLAGAVFSALPATVLAPESVSSLAVTIPDSNLRAAIAEQLGRQAGEPVTDSDMAGLRELNAPNAGIGSLEGLQYATGLTRLDLGSGPWDPETRTYPNSNHVSDLGPILELTNLTSLDLSRNNLSGEIPPEIGELSNLYNLNLSNNSLTGQIPPTIGNLSQLQYLYLWSNQLNGNIPPELGHLSKLVRLYLSNNKLSGKIPTTLGNLISLMYINLSNNNLEQEIPVEIGNLLNLVQFVISNNELTGQIPVEIGELYNLEWLDLSRNNITGSIPSEIGALSELKRFYLQVNNLTGSIPAELGSLSELLYLNLSDNHLNGSIPVEIGNLSNLISLNFFTNSLTGLIPTELGQLSNLKTLVICNTQLTGPIPPDLGNLQNLEELYLYSNDLTGPIPPELGELSELTLIELQYNMLSGSIPPQLGSLSKLSKLYLHNNNLSGQIPEQFENLLSLERLRLDNNRIEGKIPPGLLEICETVDCMFNQDMLFSSIDSDGDGITDLDDDFPFDTNKSVDSDDDGISDDLDPFPNDSAIGDLRIFKNNLVTMPIRQNLTTEKLQLEEYSNRLYLHFEDKFDHLMIVSNVKDLRDNEIVKYSGSASRVSNNISGIGLEEFYANEYGSAGKLKRLIHFSFLDAIQNGPGLHEVMHTWGNFVLQTSAGSHWGFSGVYGQLGGFNPDLLTDLGDGRYTVCYFCTNANGGNRLPYSEIELYLAGFIPSHEVPTFLHFPDGKWVEENGEIVRHFNWPIFSGTPTIVTIEDIIAKHGERVPDWQDSQKEFRAATILIYNEDDPPTDEDMLNVSSQVRFFSHTGPDDLDAYNFYEATRGIATIEMDDLGNFVRNPSGAAFVVPPQLPESYGEPPDTHFHYEHVPH